VRPGRSCEVLWWSGSERRDLILAFDIGHERGAGCNGAKGVDYQDRFSRRAGEGMVK
jgi:hypothetical protein